MGDSVKRAGNPLKSILHTIGTKFRNSKLGGIRVRKGNTVTNQKSSNIQSNNKNRPCGPTGPVKTGSTLGLGPRGLPVTGNHLKHKIDINKEEVQTAAKTKAIGRSLDETLKKLEKINVETNLAALEEGDDNKGQKYPPLEVHILTPEELEAELKPQ